MITSTGRILPTHLIGTGPTSSGMGGWPGERPSPMDEGIEKFGNKFMKVKLNLTNRSEETNPNEETDPDGMRYGAVWEIWDAKTRRRIFVADGQEMVLESKPDPLNLAEFFPCPRPAYATLTNDHLIPVADSVQYLSLAEELDQISERIRGLTRMMRLVGVYDAKAEELGNLLQTTRDGEMIGVTNFAALLASGSGQGGGLNGVLAFLPIQETAAALINLYDARAQVKAVLDEISGVSDIARGKVDPREKAAQSKLRAGFVTQRLEMRRRGVERVARDVSRIQVEIMAELFTPETLREQSGFDHLSEVVKIAEDEEMGPPAVEQLWQQVVELLTSEKSRGFRVDVETDSTIEMDATQTQEARTEFSDQRRELPQQCLAHHAS